MIELITLVLKIGLGIFVWFWSKKEEREQRAKEIGLLFNKVVKEGDILGEQIHKEMSKHSGVGWGEIKPRDPNGGTSGTPGTL